MWLLLKCSFSGYFYILTVFYEIFPQVLRSRRTQGCSLPVTVGFPLVLSSLSLFLSVIVMLPVSIFNPPSLSCSPSLLFSSAWGRSGGCLVPFCSGASTGQVSGQSPSRSLWCLQPAETSSRVLQLLCVEPREKAVLLVQKS